MEGIVTVAVGIFVYFVLPDNGQTAYFLTARQKELVRIRDEQRKEYMGEAKLTKTEIMMAFKDPKVYISGWIQFTCDICLYGRSSWIPALATILADSL